MKHILSVILALFTITSNAGQLDSVKCSNGWVIHVGDTLKLGTGTMADKSFAYVGTAPNLLSTIPIPLGRSYAGLNIVVKRITTIKLKGAKTVELVVGGGNIVNYRVQIEPAIEFGEILPPFGYQKNIQPSITIQNDISVADELVKLKKLFDDGILSKDEFEAQKKKLLEK